MQARIYGISNCDTVKLARAWLEGNGVENEFHDFKKAGLSRERINSWLEHTSWETLLNRRGLTWRNLPDAKKTAIKDTASAVALMLEKPSVIKRPVLEYGKKLLVGFDAGRYASVLLQKP
jgi:arsenate reductase (glutaredoxin)